MNDDGSYTQLQPVPAPLSDDAGPEAVGFEEEVSILGDMDFLHALTFVRFVGFNEANRNGIPSDGFVGGLVENLSGE